MNEIEINTFSLDDKVLVTPDEDHIQPFEARILGVTRIDDGTLRYTVTEKGNTFDNYYQRELTYIS